jgi:hypothetical protein
MYFKGGGTNKFYFLVALILLVYQEYACHKNIKLNIQYLGQQQTKDGMSKKTISR